ncbi:unnamed protein product [Paramecium primaurelia]|uniref:Transmembrane protein n=1 Tax=Paramecium primaurelia TaxID=5886 RepID=A0A8S1NJG6_PARPR|nr:unnamed protein product [Paramecium primaurelia]
MISISKSFFHLNVLLLQLLLLSAICFLNSFYEEVNNKQILFKNTNCKCNDQKTVPLQAFDPSKGMSQYVIKFRTQLTLNYLAFKSILIKKKRSLPNQICFNYILICMVIKLLMIMNVLYCSNIFLFKTISTYFLGQIIIIVSGIKQQVD